MRQHERPPRLSALASKHLPTRSTQRKPLDSRAYRSSLEFHRICSDMYKALDALARKVGVIGIFSDWPHGDLLRQLYGTEIGIREQQAGGADIFPLS